MSAALRIDVHLPEERVAGAICAHRARRVELADLVDARNLRPLRDLGGLDRHQVARGPDAVVLMGVARPHVHRVRLSEDLLLARDRVGHVECQAEAQIALGDLPDRLDQVDAQPCDVEGAREGGRGLGGCRCRIAGGGRRCRICCCRLGRAVVATTRSEESAKTQCSGGRHAALHHVPTRDPSLLALVLEMPFELISIGLTVLPVALAHRPQLPSTRWT